MFVFLRVLRGSNRNDSQRDFRYLARTLVQGATTVPFLHGSNGESGVGNYTCKDSGHGLYIIVASRCAGTLWVSSLRQKGAESVILHFALKAESKESNPVGTFCM